MRVLILGGYGVFGSRLARLLVRDGHDVCVAGRDIAAAQRLSAALGCQARQFDRAGGLEGLSDFDVVIDAAGPFHGYGDDPYRLARAAIGAGMHYLDLSDNTAFCAGITALDQAARGAGVCVVSGLSSVPALSSAAVRALAGDDRPRVIDSAILPGNRSPRGVSVMASILSQAGRPMEAWRGREWCRTFGWSEPRDYRLPDGTMRQAWQIEVPDQRLFPAHFGADSVQFRAGLELAVMRYGLAAFALLRRALPIPVNGFVVGLFKRAADLLAPFGSGRGGMVVTVIVGQERRSWRLLVEDGDGPFIPAVAARALLRRPALDPGARPALEVITLAEAEAAISDLKARSTRDIEALAPIFPRVLGPAFDALPAAIRDTHLTADRSCWQGRASVRRGRGPWSRFLATLFRFPQAAEDIPVEVIKTVTPGGETWQRRFGTRSFRSHLAATPAGMTERFGPFAFRLGLTVQDGALYYPVVSGRLGPLPLPRWLLPVSEAREYEGEDGFRFDVRLLAPFTGELLVHYRGHLRAAKGSNPRR